MRVALDQRLGARLRMAVIAPNWLHSNELSMDRTLATILMMFAILTVTNERARSEENSSRQFQVKVAPVLKSHCFQCHNANKASANLDLTSLDPDLVNGRDAESWHDVLNKLNLGEMPPEDARQLSGTEREDVVEWLTLELRHAAEVRRSTGGRTVLRRLTRYEYANTLRDLLGIDLDFAADLPPEPASPDGFRNNGRTLSMSPLQLEYYLKTARLALDKVIVERTLPRTFTHRATKSVSLGGRQKNTPVGSHLYPGWFFVTRMDEFPREGEFVIRAECAMRVPSGAVAPTLAAKIGVRADTLTPMKTVGELLIDAPLDQPRIYEFRGRIEEFPLPGKNPKFPGLVVALTQPGESSTKPKKRNRKKQQIENDSEFDDPTKPMIRVNWISFEGPVFDAWPPTSHTRILFDSENQADSPLYSREVLARFMRRAFRRPVKPSEVEEMVSLYKVIRSRTDSFEEAIKEVLALTLITPDFLYLLEPRPGENSSGQASDQNLRGEQTRIPLTDHELANRLSYFLWSTMPHEGLSKLADEGQLSNTEILEQQTRAMIEDPRSWNFVENFVGQWLDLSGIERVAINPEFYPDFDETLKKDMRLETLHYFKTVLRENLSALTLIDSDFVVINQRLAKHYGIQGVAVAGFQRVSVDAQSHRGGVITHAGILLASSTGEDSHPIRRAVWILDRLLDDPPPPPPPDVPELNTDARDLAAMPLKKQLELHREREACNACHRKIDPWGIPLENFDAVGQWRTSVIKPVRKRGKFLTTPVDASSTLPGGQRITQVDALKRHLVEHERDRFAKALVTRLFAYALGRSPELGDEATIDRLTREFQDGDYRIAELIVAIVQSEEFRTK